MHVKAKQLAFLGLLAAMISVMIVLAALLKTNTLFLLAAAAYLVGIAIRETGLRYGFGLFAACILLGILISPNKLYVLTYAGFSLYIVWDEVLYRILTKIHFQKYRRTIFFFAKLLFFDAFFIPILYFFPKLLFVQVVSTPVFMAFLAGGQLFWLIYDKAYDYFQVMVWGKLRKKIRLLDE